MREMIDSGVNWVGEIPIDWKIAKLKYTFTESNVGESIDRDFNSDAGYIYYTAGLNPIRTNYELFPESKYTQKNDLLLSRNGTPYVYLPAENAIYSDHIIRIKIKSNYDKRFII